MNPCPIMWETVKTVESIIEKFPDLYAYKPELDYLIDNVDIGNPLELSATQWVELIEKHRDNFDLVYLGEYHDIREIVTQYLDNTGEKPNEDLRDYFDYDRHYSEALSEIRWYYRHGTESNPYYFLFRNDL